ncbi:MAG: Conserved secreted protein of unknown function, putative domain, partial [Solirubrobacterales bacterium]|nr:Conserved secreted protein of unknown function, putative domain [Solirubrobacterales bacterium]
NAVKYRPTSGATVFSTGTNQWAYALGTTRIDQATYNILSDMGTQPFTPASTIVLDPAGSNQTPTASFTVAPNPAHANQTVTFDATASGDADGTITKLEWDLDGNGTYETNTGTTRTVTRTYTADATIDVHLRVTDNLNASDFTTRTLTVIANFPPTASLSITPNPAVVGQNVTFDASASADPDGTITTVEWDLDGNGTYETNTATVKTTTRAYTTPGTFTLGVRVTDNGGKTATAAVPLTVTAGGVSSYGDTVLATAGLTNYWRMGEAAGPSLADSTGGASATATGGTFGVPGGPPGDPNTAVRFNGSTDSARAAVNLTSTSKVTVEFWLKWNAYSNNDALAMEFTPNFNGTDGGFLVDPNAPQFGGTFGVALGRAGSRNNVFFARPSAGAWHHYAFILDTTAPGASQITPYVDGRAVTYQKSDSGTGAGPFASSTLYWMSRGGSSLFGAGDLDEVAMYDRTLSAATIAEHAAASGTNQRPVAAFSVSPNPARPGVTVTFDGSASRDPDGTIARYQWDLDGNGSYETDTGSASRVTRSYATAQTIDVNLKVIDTQFGEDTETHTLVVGNGPPTAAFTVQPSPAVVGQTVTFDASASTDPDGTITKVEWDLDGNGTYETNAGTSRTTSTTYATRGTVNVGLRVTDNDAATATKTVPLTVNSGGVSNYGDSVLATSGLARYWRMGETAGPSLADSTGGASATATGGTFAVPGGPPGDPNTAVRFNGTSDSARATVNLASTSKVTVEFWLKWNAYANNDALAMEFTPNFNGADGGFLVDPNAPQFGGTFGVALGRFGSRNNAFFARPSAGVWHHYAFVLDTTAPAATQITPYVDGTVVTYQKLDSGTGAGPFASSTLYWMSRGGTSLFGAGDVDEVAIYTRALDAATIGGHADASGTNRRPIAAFTATPSTVTTGTTVNFNASGSSDPDGTITRYEWDLDGNGSYETNTGTVAAASKAYATQGTVTVGLRVTDDRTGTATVSHDVVVSNAPPPPPPPSGSYSSQVLGTAGLVDYWRMGDPGPTVLTDAKGPHNATLTGGTAGIAGAPAGGTDTAVRFNGTTDWASALVDLSATSAITVEFWLKWTAFGASDDLAMELTPNFNTTTGGFIIDPDAGGSFGVGIGLDASRNNAYFTPPSAGAWHHYAFVLDTTAPAATQVTPYVDGTPVPYSKGASGTGGGPFANAALYFMSRAGQGHFGSGELDEVALYDRPLSAATIAAHAAAGGT